jgi:ATP adenylyltransferase
MSTANSHVNPANTLGRPDSAYTETIERIRETGECPFCPEHLHREHGLPIIIDGVNWTVTDNKYPYNGSENHVLFVHKEHITTLGEMSVEAWQELQEVLKETTRLRKIGGGTLIMRMGDTDYTGASVAHLHAQLISGSGNPADEPLLARVGNKIILPE